MVKHYAAGHITLLLSYGSSCLRLIFITDCHSGFDRSDLKLPDDITLRELEQAGSLDLPPQESTDPPPVLLRNTLCVEKFIPLGSFADELPSQTWRG